MGTATDPVARIGPVGASVQSKGLGVKVGLAHRLISINRHHDVHPHLIHK